MLAQSCPSRETLLQFSVGMLSSEQSDSLAGHLEACADCQATIVKLEDHQDTLIGSLRTPLSSKFYLAEPQFHTALAQAIAKKSDLPQSPAGPEKNIAQKAAIPFSLGEYHVLEELGHGGMGHVYKALHTKLDRIVALKVLPRAAIGDRRAITRFEREMKAVGRLNHPNIVQAFDAREIDGTPVLIMEFIDGFDLAEIVHRVERVPVAEACELARQTALALQCAFEHGLVHRDVKPSNIMLNHSGEVKLLDLGLARFYAESDTGLSFAPGGGETTGAGQAMGTADYMAPEQIADSRSVDIRADLYSLGCTLYKLLSGSAPFSDIAYRSTHEKLEAHINQPVMPIRRLVADVPEKVSAILDRLLAKNPADRFATPAAVADALTSWCANANLAVLLKRAVEKEQRPDVVGQLQPLSSPKTDSKSTSITSQCPHRFTYRLNLLLIVCSLCVTLGIVIHIYKDGRETTIELPAGSKASITRNGDVNIELPKQEKSVESTKGRFIGRLPQGTVELLGITDYPVTNKSQWWKPDGSEVELGPYLLVPSRSSISLSRKPITFLLRISDLPTGASHAVWDIKPYAGSWMGNRVMNAQAEAVPDYHMFSAEIGASSAVAATLRVGVSMGAWDTVLTQKADSGGTSSFDREGRQWTVTFLKPAEGTISNTTRVTLTDDFEYGKFYTRLLAITNDGSQLAASIGYISHQGSATFNLPLSSIKEIHFQVRPFYWVEFKNVSLQPGQETEVQIILPDSAESPAKEPAGKPDPDTG